MSNQQSGAAGHPDFQDRVDSLGERLEQLGADLGQLTP